MKVYFVVTGITNPILYEALDKGVQFLSSYAAILNNDKACYHLLEKLKEMSNGKSE